MDKLPPMDGYGIYLFNLFGFGSSLTETYIQIMFKEIVWATFRFDFIYMICHLIESASFPDISKTELCMTGRTNGM